MPQGIFFFLSLFLSSTFAFVKNRSRFDPIFGFVCNAFEQCSFTDASHKFGISLFCTFFFVLLNWRYNNFGFSSKYFALVHSIDSWSMIYISSHILCFRIFLCVNLLLKIPFHWQLYHWRYVVIMSDHRHRVNRIWTKNLKSFFLLISLALSVCFAWSLFLFQYIHVQHAH